MREETRARLINGYEVTDDEIKELDDLIDYNEKLKEANNDLSKHIDNIKQFNIELVNKNHKLSEINDLLKSELKIYKKLVDSQYEYIDSLNEILGEYNGGYKNL